MSERRMKSEQNRFAPLIFIIVVAIIAYVAIKMIDWGDVQLRAEGDLYEIIVFADSTDYIVLEHVLREALGQEISTPQPEQLFTLFREDIENLTRYRRQKNIIIVAPLDGDGTTAEYMNAALSERVQDMVRSGEEFMINRYHSNARGQLIMYLTGPSLENLNNNILHNADRIFYHFHNFALRREIEDVTREKRHAKTKLSEQFFEDYGWTMFIQHDYYLALNNPESNFVWLRRATPSDMERWIFVHWIDDAEPHQITPAFIRERRDKLTQQFFRTIDDKAYVRIAPDYHEIQEINFKDRYGVKVRGLWRFSDFSGGGPFINYTFYDEDSGRIYMLDGSIFAPRYEKKKLILQVQALLNTFEPGTDVDGDAIQQVFEDIEPVNGN
jgi:hypothetical protein